MPKPVSRRDLIRRLRLLGFAGPESGKRHQAMRKGSHTVPIPNPHGSDIDWTLVQRILKQAGVSREEWDSTAQL
jgi:hypothetical protein